ncbi:hypothetical protein SDC9_83893 [bioreactor metagenome]|uniref:Uncharacterized protein n=1 Tax=bioreactor metagenome TaxID=1076179 RepID=A0A644ZHH6_9ZZZZ
MCLPHAEDGHGLPGDVRVVVVSGEELGAEARCEERNGDAGVGVGGPADAGLPVEDVGDLHREGLVAAVEQEGGFVLGPFLLLEHAVFEGRPEFAQFEVGEGHGEGDPGFVIAGPGLFLEGGAFFGGGGAEPEGSGDEGHHLLEGLFAFFAEGGDLPVEGLVGLLLVGDLLEEGFVLGSGEADAHAAGLMVSHDDDQRLVRVLLSEGQGFLHGRVEGEGVADGCSRVVRVAGPVDLAALDHKEEPFRVVEHLDALAGEFGEGEFLIRPVHVVGHGVAAVQDGIHRYDLRAGLRREDVFPGAENLVALLLRDFVQIFAVLFLAGALVQPAAGEEIEAAVDELLSDAVVVVPGRDGGVKGCGGGVVQGDGGEDADFHSLGADHLGDGGELLFLGGVHADDAVVRLVARGEGRGRGGRVGDEGVGGVGGDHPLHREAAQGQLLDRGLAARPVDGTVVNLRRVDLLEPQAVADEHENVLCLPAAPVVARPGRPGRRCQRQQDNERQSCSVPK